MSKLLKFSRKGCNPCVMLENKLKGEDIPFESYDVEVDLVETAKYGIGGLPTLILVDDSGEVVDRTVGFNPPEIDAIVEKL